MNNYLSTLLLVVISLAGVCAFLPSARNAPKVSISSLHHQTTFLTPSITYQSVPSLMMKDMVGASVEINGGKGA